jgi:hypothetical protein
MFYRVSEFFLNPPSRLQSLGKLFYTIGGALLGIGLYLRLGPILVGMTRNMARIVAPPITLAEMYPAFPTWFIPEGPLGFTVAITLLVVGIVCQWQARTFQRMWGAM